MPPCATGDRFSLTKSAGPNHPDLASTLNNLARVMIEQRRSKEAIPLLTRSMNIYLAQREDTPTTSPLSSQTWRSQSWEMDDAEAETLFRRGLTAAEVTKIA